MIDINPDKKAKDNFIITQTIHTEQGDYHKQLNINSSELLQIALFVKTMIQKQYSSVPCQTCPGVGYQDCGWREMCLKQKSFSAHTLPQCGLVWKDHFGNNQE